MKQIRFIISLLAVVLFSTAAWGEVGPQSFRLVFDGSDHTDWKISDSGSSTVSAGVMNVTMGLSGTKYRGDLQYEKAGKYTLDKTKDIIWAIKLTEAIPSSSESGHITNKKFEIEFIDGSGNKVWLNNLGNQFTPTLACADGGKIYYFDISAAAHYSDIQDGDVSISKIHFVFADAEVEAAAAHYSIDWAASFTSLDDLKFYQDWKDEQTDFTQPVFEFLYRPGNSGFPKSGVNTAEFEGNYNAKLFAVQYYLVENFSLEKIYTLGITNSASNRNGLSVWNFSQVVSTYTTDADITSKATSVVGIAPGSTSGSINTPINSATISNVGDTYTFEIPASSLTRIATIDGKTLVGVLITNTAATTANNKGKFASSSHTTITKPSFTKTGTDLSTYTIVNSTKLTSGTDLATMVEGASAGDVLTICKDITVSARISILKDLTIQGATGAQKITCAVPVGDDMLRMNGNSNYTVTFKDLKIDGTGSEQRTIQTFDTNDKAEVCLNGVTFSNFTYSDGIGDVKCSGRNIVLSGNNTFCKGIVLSRYKNINHSGATHTDANPVKLLLAYDFIETNTVMNCTNTALYTVEDVNNKADWELYVDGSNLRARRTALVLADNYNNNSTLEACDGKTMNVTLNRTIARNGTDYATFSAPFAITRSALEYYLGTTEVLRYKRTDIDGEDAILVFDDDVEDLEAGVPYLIKPLVSGEDVTTMTFNGVTIDKTVREAEDTHYRFIPLFSQTNVGTGRSDDKSVVYLGGGNQLYWAQATCNIKGFRAYFEAKNVASPAMKSVRRMSIGRNGAPTAIDDVQSNDTKVQKILRDGQVIIIRDGIEYNAFGQRIQ